MKQVIIKQKKLVVEDIPAPIVEKGSILVEVVYSLISTGTELTGIKSARRSTLMKLREKPERFVKALQHIQQKGFKRTIYKAKGTYKNTQLGYSCAGTVIAVGEDVKEFRIGDNVACAGAGKANHAEIVLIPRNLAVRIPNGCKLRDAASVAIGAIAMQGVRRADIKLGETIAVLGLGLLGQITVQVLKAAGVHVVGFDIDDERVALAKLLGVDYSFNIAKIDYVKYIFDITNGHGVDASIITAASNSNEVVQQAMEITRKKGRVVVVGAVGLGLKRSPLYQKEIDFLISCSYGPGRYDTTYEERGLDYPFAYVRWTEQRNMEEYLKLIADDKLKLSEIIHTEYPIEEAPKAYSRLRSTSKKPVGIILSYRKNHEKRYPKIISKKLKTVNNKIKIAIIGAGNFAKAVHLPNLQKLNEIYDIFAIVDKMGLNAKSLAEEYNASFASTNFDDVLQNKDIHAVLIATRHNTHAQLAIQAARKGKAIFLEKPMALHKKDLHELILALKQSQVPFMVGYNRRFSPWIIKAQEMTSQRFNPMIINYRMNAGFIPKEHWVQTEEGGGRNIGEACHIYDLFNFFTNSRISSITARSISPKTEHYLKNDNFVTTLSYEDGSICTLTYTALGSKKYSKEKMDIYVDGNIIQINDYKEMQIFGHTPILKKSKYQDKGHLEELKTFGKSLLSGDGYPIPLWHLIQAAEISLHIETQL